MKAKYFLYKNIRTGKFSITYDGLVIERTSAVKLFDVDFNVSQKGRKRVLKERRKNVHAKLGGASFKLLEEGGPISLDGYIEVTYNPYKNEHFTIVETGEYIAYCSEVLCVNGKVYV